MTQLAQLLKEDEEEGAGDGEESGDEAGEGVLVSHDDLREEEGASEVQMQDAGEVGSTDGVADEGEGGVSQVNLEQLEAWLKSQGHRARRTAKGRVLIDPAPKPKPSGDHPTLAKQLSKLKVVTPLMRTLEF